MTQRPFSDSERAPPGRAPRRRETAGRRPSKAGLSTTTAAHAACQGRRRPSRRRIRPRRDHVAGMAIGWRRPPGRFCTSRPVEPAETATEVTLSPRWQTWHRCVPNTPWHVTWRSPNRWCVMPRWPGRPVTSFSVGHSRACRRRHASSRQGSPSSPMPAPDLRVDR